MSSRTKERRAARILALDALYQAEIREQLPSEALSLLGRDDWSVTLSETPVDAGPPSEEAVSYATRLVEGFQSHAPDIDQLIDKCADRWALERMPVVDKNLLRLAVYELLWEPDIPPAVVINEAIELAKSLSTAESGRFINGILGRVTREAQGGGSD